MSEMTIQQWAQTIRREALKMIHSSTGGHPGGALSMAEILAVLYFRELRIDPAVPRSPSRDRFVLSKGHGCAALYAALGLKGYFDSAEFQRFRRLDGLLQGHPSVAIPGIDAPSGSLGMGLSQGLGMALGGRCLGHDFRTYVVLGDGDMQEGNTWEAIMAAGHHRVASLCAILDANGLQAEGRVSDIMDFGPLAEKIRVFGWNVADIDGHDTDIIGHALDQAREEKGCPTFIIARTVKGKGVAHMENKPQWHGTVKISTEDLDQALNGLSN